MFESFVAVPAHFTVEFLGFLVFLGGAVLALSRGDFIGGEPSNRVTVALGFVLLAIAQVLHGGSFQLGALDASTDGAQILIALRALGLAFVVIGVGGSIRASATPVALGPVKEVLLGVPVAAGVVLAFVATAGSRRTENKALARLAVFGILSAAADALTALAPKAGFGTRSVPPAAYAAHGIKLIAFFVLGSWFWAVIRTSIRTRFVASFAVLLVVVVMALATALTGVISGSVESSELDRVANQAEAAVRDLSSESSRELKDDVDTVAGLPSVRQRLASGGQLGGFAEEIQTLPTFELEDGFVMLMDPRGAIRGFAGQGPVRLRRGDEKPTKLRPIEIVKINGSAVIDEVARGAPEAASPDRVGRDLVALVAAHEVRDPNSPNRRAGIAALGRWIDSQTIEGISELLDVKASMVVHGKTVASTLPRSVARKQLIPPHLKSQVQSEACGTPVREQVAYGALSYFNAFACLENDAGEPVATFILSTPATSVLQTRGLFTRILFLVAMGVGAISIVLAWFSGRAITRPIQELTVAAQLVREGDLEAQAPVTGEDEVGQLGETFNEMTAALFRMTNDLRDAAREEHDLRARIETIIESMADGLVAVDSERNILAFNAAAERITGVPGNEAIGQSVQRVLDSRDAEGNKVSLPIFDLVRGAVDGIYIARKDRDPVPVTVVSAVLPGVESGASGGVAVLRDMTREREVERMKTEFLSNISHELRTPLTPIKGYAEILAKHDVDPAKARKFASGILESTTRLERIVQLLVDFAAMEAGRLAPKTTAIDVASMVNSLADEWKARSPLHSIVTDVNAELPEVVGDERLLRRSLEEVLDNAVKFSPSGGTIRLEATGHPSGNGHLAEVAITISDEGIGISPDDMGRIFSDFQQLDGSETRAYGGLGLGLAFVRRIIEAHDGSVVVESQPDRGTRLTITIPAARA
jgi:two-component system sensor histidine kinase VicK